MHREYQIRRPHDSKLYDILRISPNSTAAQIQKSYRALSRRFHPDKPHGDEEALRAIRHAYEVLKDDTTRLHYHKYGLLEPSHAAYILTGAVAGPLTPDQRLLLRLMGYTSGSRSSRHERVLILAATLVERIRPLVEDVIPPSVILDVVIRECSSLKKLPLGAQIIRCVGRAYKQAGERALRATKPAGGFTNVVRKKLRTVKHILEAAAVSGKLVFKEKLQKRQPASDFERIGHGMQENELIGEDDDLEPHFVSEDNTRSKEHAKAEKIMLASLQVEALWKIHKIDLDRTIQDACDSILAGDFFFYPSHKSLELGDWTGEADGWVTTAGRTISTSVGRVRAAKALVMIGATMVKCSKDGTSWLE